MEYIARNKSKAEQTAEPSKYPQGYFKAKPCRSCGKEFNPKAPSEHYCSDECKNRGLQNRYFERVYGITVGQYEEMLHKQEHKCAICGGEGFLMNKDRHQMKLVVDHCHETGRIRGLLCHNCNRALGLFKDKIENLSNAIDYLKV